ncbi:MAG: STAS domain-containing protein [Planctomycetota bacterium]
MALTKPRLMTQIQEDICIVTIQDATILDERNIVMLGKDLEKLVDEQHYIQMIIDMTHVSYLSSAVLGKLMALYKKIKAEKGHLKLCNVKAEIRPIFAVTQLDKVIEIHADLETAINSFKQKGFFGLFKKK